MKETQKAVAETLTSSRVIAILRKVPPERFAETVDALYRGGVRMMEVTFDQSGEVLPQVTTQQIRHIAERYAGKILPGAGTVMRAEQVDLAQKAGALYIISPNVDEGVIKRTKACGLVSMPGALTPSEAASAANWGADYVKIFPAGELGASYIKSLLGPLSGLKLLAVGNIDAENMTEFLKAGCVGVGVGGCLVNNDLIRAGNFAALTELARKFFL